VNLLPWRELRDESIQRLRAAGVEDPDQELRWIVERASGRTPSEQVASLDEPVTEREVRFVDQMVARRGEGEPLQYVLGRWGFRSLDLLVDARVLIPRPETEVVAGLAIHALPSGGVLVDLGTGSGAIALSVAAERWPDVEVWATDASPDALAVARANLAGLGRRGAIVRLVEGDWYAALPEDLRGRVDVVVSNPPYVAEDDPLPAEVADWEPRAALVPGPTGLEAIEVIVAGARDWLAPGGALVVEIGETQVDAVCALAAAAGLTDVRIEADLAARPRALVARREAASAEG
jgi:release factor glutamine methyltransferase